MASSTLTVNGVQIYINPYVQVSVGPNGQPADFQSSAGSDAVPIELTFNQELLNFTIIVVGNDLTGNELIAYDNDGIQIAYVEITSGTDAKMVTLTPDTPDSKIASVSLVPPDGGSVAYRAMQFVPAPTSPTDFIDTGDPNAILASQTPPLVGASQGQVTFNIIIDILEVVPTFYIIINIEQVAYPVLEKLLELASFKISSLFEQYIDEERYCKMLLNFGNDYQKVIINQKLSILDNEKILIKLYNPLESFVPINTPVYISREIAKTLIDKMRIEYPEQIIDAPFLRPKFFIK